MRTTSELIPQETSAMLVLVMISSSCERISRTLSNALCCRKCSEHHSELMQGITTNMDIISVIKGGALEAMVGPLVVDVQESEMVAFGSSELLAHRVRLLLTILRTEPNGRSRKHSSDRHHLTRNRHEIG